MPAYEYRCSECEIQFERRQKMSDEALETCPACGGHVKRLISGGAGAISKGAAAAPSPMPAQCGMGGPRCGGGACGMDGAGLDR